MTDLERGLSTHVAEWLDRKPRKPLVIRGARQVGKSHLVRTLARQRGLALAEVNLEQGAELTEGFESLEVPAILRVARRRSPDAALNPPEGRGPDPRARRGAAGGPP